ncbi:hypothetical protein [Flavobacterium phycosphaerae]|uniref:hypothetical protein n=1 Tax=Flavobacterium phycosphaerae TaxID=2697515 RepID=UPI00138A1D79|nr:hypothetical protein [Flavobacterium phycosphaerae]
MKLSLSILILSLGICLSSCCSQKKATNGNIILKTTLFKNGNETLSLLKNKSIDTTTKNNSLAYELKTNTTTDVIQYSYEIDMDQAAYDGGLREELLFEIPQGDFEFNLTNNELQKTKMLFGRYCYCRGQNGVFKITNGSLNISRQSGKVTLAINFHQDSVPQKIKTTSVE